MERRGFAVGGLLFEVCRLDDFVRCGEASLFEGGVYGCNMVGYFGAGEKVWLF